MQGGGDRGPLLDRGRRSNAADGVPGCREPNSVGWPAQPQRIATSCASRASRTSGSARSTAASSPIRRIRYRRVFGWMRSAWPAARGSPGMPQPLVERAEVVGAVRLVVLAQYRQRPDFGGPGRDGRRCQPVQREHRPRLLVVGDPGRHQAGAQQAERLLGLRARDLGRSASGPGRLPRPGRVRLPGPDSAVRSASQPPAPGPSGHHRVQQAVQLGDCRPAADAGGDPLPQGQPQALGAQVVPRSRPAASIATTRCGTSARSSSAAATRTLPSPSSSARTRSAECRRSASTLARRRNRCSATTEPASANAAARASGTRSGTTAHIEPSSSPPIRIGTISLGSVPSRCAATKIVVPPRDSSRNTPRDRNRASTSSGTRRPMIVDTRAGSVRSCRAE